MTDSRLLSNQRVTVLVGPASGIADFTAPTLAELTALTNVSGAVNWDSFDFNLQASDSSDDRTLTDGAGAKSRGVTNFGGNIEFVYPKPDDTDSIFRTAYNILSGDRTQLAIVIRTVALNSTPIATGDVVNAYRVLEDAHSLVRATQSKPSYAYKVNFLSQDSVGVNCIVPSAVPTAVTLTPSGSTTGTVGSVGFLKATYEGVNVTIGATYTTSNSSVAEVTPHGCVIFNGAGTADITATYPGSAAGTATTYTVS